MSSTHDPFSAEQLDELRRLFGLSADEEPTGRMVLTALEAQRVVDDEAAYLAAALRFGWLRWSLEVDDPPG